MNLRNQTILITSNEPWGELWYSKQNYAYELSKNNKVYFINPPVKWKVSNLINNRVSEVGRYNENLIVLAYENYLPILNNSFNRLNNYLVSQLVKQFLNKNKIKKFIFWAFDPVRLFNPKTLGAELAIYHCVDYYYFKFLGETILCETSDLLFATSQLFLNEYKIFNKPKFVVPHGISSEEFDISPAELEKFDLSFEDYALYIGVIDHRIDFELVEQAIIKFSRIPFVFVGPLRLPESKAAERIFNKKIYSNVHAIGPRHFKQLKVYVRKAAFCISFMDPNYHANTVHHHKTLVYLTQGKPVFSYLFNEYTSLGNIMYMDTTGDGILLLMEEFINQGEDPNLSNVRIEYARKYTFENVLKNAEKIIESVTSNEE